MCYMPLRCCYTVELRNRSVECRSPYYNHIVMSGESAHPTLGPVRDLKHPRDGYRFEGGRKAATLRESINDEVPVDLLEFNSGLPEVCT